MDTFVPRAGAVRCRNQRTGEWMYSNPGDPTYSTALMTMEEYWNPDKNEWLKVEDLDNA